MFVNIWSDWQPFEILCTWEFLICYLESSYILSVSHAGMDAQVAYGFHHLRNEKPYLAQGPIANKVWLNVLIALSEFDICIEVLYDKHCSLISFRP